MEFAYIAFGWVLGITGNIVVEAWRQAARNRELKAAIIKELKHVQPKLVHITYRLVSGYGEFNSAFVEWYIEKLEQYPTKGDPGTNYKTMRSLQEIGDKGILKYGEKVRAEKATRGLFLWRLDLPLIRANLGAVQRLGGEFPALVSAVLMESLVYNEIVSETQFSFQSTFDSSLTTFNRNAHHTNLDLHYKNAGAHAKLVVDAIHDILPD